MVAENFHNEIESPRPAGLADGENRYRSRRLPWLTMKDLAHGERCSLDFLAVALDRGCRVC